MEAVAFHPLFLPLEIKVYPASFLSLWLPLLKLNIIIDMSYELTGKLHKKYPTENKTDSFQAREFVVLMESGNYPQYIKLQLTQDRCALLDPYEEGQEIKVHFDLRGREWNEKYFTNLNAWRIEAPAAATAPSASAGEENFFPAAGDEPTVAADDDLPF